MKKINIEISPEQKEIAVRHSTNNIVRSIVLMKRAVNTLTFANESLEGTGMNSMVESINEAKRSLADAIRTLSKYTNNEEKEDE